MNQNRLRSKGAWVSVAALLGFFLGNYGLYEALGLTNETYQQLVDLIFACISAFGIWNNPTTSKEF